MILSFSTFPTSFKHYSHVHQYHSPNHHPHNCHLHTCANGIAVFSDRDRMPLTCVRKSAHTIHPSIHPLSVPLSLSDAPYHRPHPFTHL